MHKKVTIFFIYMLIGVTTQLLATGNQGSLMLPNGNFADGTAHWHNTGFRTKDGYAYLNINSTSIFSMRNQIDCHTPNIRTFSFDFAWNNGTKGGNGTRNTIAALDVHIDGVRYLYISTPRDGGANVDNATHQGGDALVRAYNGATFTIDNPSSQGSQYIDPSSYLNWTFTTITIHLPENAVKEGRVKFYGRANADDIAIDNARFDLPENSCSDTGPCDKNSPDFVDTDGDGIGNACDVDDDNDGILDITECNMLQLESAGTFGETTVPRNPAYAIDKYKYVTYNGGAEKGSGKYAIVNGSYQWHQISTYWAYNGHTTGTNRDAYLAVNGSEVQGVFYQQEVDLLAGRDYNISFWHADAAEGINLPDGYNLEYRLTNISNGSIVSSGSTGMVSAPIWTKQSTIYTPTESGKYKFELLNISLQYGGNDFAIDDISIKPTKCTDTDGDGIVDSLDLDKDNDTIPDNVEAQPTAGYVPPTGLDTDGDGLDDAYDTDNGGTPVANTDTDHNGIADALELDSDKDGISDIVEVNQSDMDNNGKTDNDVGNNGLDDTIESDDNYEDPNGNVDIPSHLPNIQNPKTAEVDYRDSTVPKTGLACGLILLNGVGKENVTIQIQDSNQVSSTVVTDNEGKYCVNIPLGTTTFTVDTNTLPEDSYQVEGTNPTTILTKEGNNDAGTDSYSIAHS